MKTDDGLSNQRFFFVDASTGIEFELLFVDRDDQFIVAQIFRETIVESHMGRPFILTKNDRRTTATSTIIGIQNQGVALTLKASIRYQKRAVVRSAELTSIVFNRH